MILPWDDGVRAAPEQCLAYGCSSCSLAEFPGTVETDQSWSCPVSFGLRGPAALGFHPLWSCVLHVLEGGEDWREFGHGEADFLSFSNWLLTSCFFLVRGMFVRFLWLFLTGW